MVHAGDRRWKRMRRGRANRRVRGSGPEFLDLVRWAIGRDFHETSIPEPLWKDDFEVEALVKSCFGHMDDPIDANEYAVAIFFDDPAPRHTPIAAYDREGWNETFNSLDHLKVSIPYNANHLLVEGLPEIVSLDAENGPPTFELHTRRMIYQPITVPLLIASQDLRMEGRWQYVLTLRLVQDPDSEPVYTVDGDPYTWEVIVELRTRDSANAGQRLSFISRLLDRVRRR
ncbi:uncharacterized protein LOC111268208 [Varroa jacobsoni]|uniref:Uncharacterized protein n=1 Tax=Varroa destructor TaxID=109461 RepID=A0A7M7JRF4_VARDE|nr:uncharacterized protein LOC111245667 [Varroa destructor]XP_022702765.1 uncharacterized protein LOC111268208 [Varroa jacobsoni]